ncbi:MAG: ABC transporter ATP-binding protein [Synergistaceae bacterium]|nr:ABC transporter ATP-binding protein [Synergistaceae bacterium]
MIKINDLSVTYPNAPRKAVNSASLVIRKGTVTGLVGESGSGKSTLLMSIPKLLPKGTMTSGSAEISSIPSSMCSAEEANINIFDLADDHLRKIRWKKISIVPQGSMNSFNPTMTIFSGIYEVMSVHLGMKKYEAKKRINELFESVGLDPKLAFRYPHELSGGQKQRAAIATALACDPDYLLADEPTTALDVITQKEVLETLVTLVKQRNMGMLLVTHDLPLAASVSEVLAVMQYGEIVESGEVRKIISAPTHRHTVDLVNCSVNFTGQEGFYVNVKEDEHKVFETKGLCVNYGKNEEIKAVNKVSISMKKGGTLSIVGESGSGKTTLIRSILGLVHPSEGDTELFGNKINKAPDMKKIELRRRCGYVPQDPYGSLPPTLTVLQAVTEPWMIVRKGAHKEGEERAKALLEELKIGSELWNNRVKYSLSGGQRQRVCIARALILEPELLLCDEPTAMQDVSTRGEILSVLKNRVEKGMSMVFVTHDLHLARYASDKCVVLWRGEIVESLKSADIMKNASHQYTKSLIGALPEIKNEN